MKVYDILDLGENPIVNISALELINNGFNASVVAGALTANHIHTLQNKTGILAHLNDIPAATGDGIYSGLGTIPTATIATVTDTINFQGGLFGVGITPLAKLHIKEVGSTGGTTALLVENGNVGSLMKMAGDGLVSIMGSTNIYGLLVTSNVLNQYGLRLNGNATTAQLLVEASLTNGIIIGSLAGGEIGMSITSSGGATASRQGISCIVDGSNTSTNTALVISANGGSSNRAIQVNNGDFRFVGAAGTKIGQASSDKFAFWGKTPIIQPTTGITAAAFVANSSGISDDTATFGGYTIGQLAQIIINTGLTA